MANQILHEYLNSKKFKKKALGGKAYYYFLDIKDEERLLFLNMLEYFDLDFRQINTYINFDCISAISFKARVQWGLSSVSEKNWRYCGDSLSFVDYLIYKGEYVLNPTPITGSFEIRTAGLINYLETDIFPFYNTFNDLRSLLSYFANNEKLIKTGSFLYMIMIIRKLTDHPLYMETWDLIDLWLKTVSENVYSDEFRLRNLYWEVLKDVKPLYEWKDEYLDPNTIYPGAIVK